MPPRPSAVVDILIRSYFRDFRWLGYCLRAVERYARGFRRVLVVVPPSSRGWLGRVDLRGARVAFSAEYADDYLGQQVTKLEADLLTDADYVCHLDSDCLLRRPTSPSDLLPGGRPELWRTPFSALAPSVPWKLVTERFLGRAVTHDFMRRPPFVYPRWLYAELRRHALSLHGVTVGEYVLAQPPRGFSEFNALGAFAWAHHREAFAWPEVPPEEPNEGYCRWYWSWSGITPEVESEVERLLGSPAPAPEARRPPPRSR